MLQKIRIFDLKEVGSNEKGSTFQASTGDRSNFLAGYRKQGSLNGCHYHKGNSFEKNPEILFFMHGHAELYCKDLDSGEAYTYKLDEPKEIHIYPMVWHELKALTDIVFFEMNSLEAHKNDTFYEKNL